MLAPVHIEQNLRDERDAPISPGLHPPILLRQKPAFPKREAPKLRVTQAEALTLKAPELLPGDPSKGFVSSWTSPLTSTGGGVGLAACHA